LTKKENFVYNENGQRCKICNSLLLAHDRAEVLKKYNVAYYFCPNCGFIQTEDPYWLEESYSKAIATADTGIISRNLSNAADLLFILKFIKNSNCLDFGGGHGILTRIMRDYGFNFYHYDKYAENLFANGFEGSLEGNYNLVTSFENFEHFSDPIAEIKKIVKIADVIYFSTELIPMNVPKIKDWWYFVPSTGQHVSFYSKKSLEFIARKFGLYYISNNHSVHILSKNPMNGRIFVLLKLYNRFNRINILRFLKRPSKTFSDMKKIING
jgi:hypothetical protein